MRAKLTHLPCLLHFALFLAFLLFLSFMLNCSFYLRFVFFSPAPKILAGAMQQCKNNGLQVHATLI